MMVLTFHIWSIWWTYTTALLKDNKEQAVAMIKEVAKNGVMMRCSKNLAFDENILTMSYEVNMHAHTHTITKVQLRKKKTSYVFF